MPAPSYPIPGEFVPGSVALVSLILCVFTVSFPRSPDPYRGRQHTYHQFVPRVAPLLFSNHSIWTLISAALLPCFLAVVTSMLSNFQERSTYRKASKPAKKRHLRSPRLMLK
jgi:hypothetical protein